MGDYQVSVLENTEFPIFFYLFKMVIARNKKELVWLDIVNNQRRKLRFNFSDYKPINQDGNRKLREWL